MKSDVLFSCVISFLLALLIEQSDGQFPVCSDFYSPLLIKAHGTGVGVIQFPRRGKKYQRNQVCEWTIVADNERYAIRLDVIKSTLQGRDLDGECNNDYVDIFDYNGHSSVFMDRFCGSDKGKTYQTASRRMTVRFYSDASFEYEGFQAMYQPVPVAPSMEQQQEDHKRLLAMAIGIPVGLLSLAVVVIFSIFMIRWISRRKTTARSPSAIAHSQNAAHQGLHGGNPTIVAAGSAGQGSSRRHHQGLSGQPERSITPPPAYDSLDFGPGELRQNEMPLTPPPYEMAVKQHMVP